MLKAALLFSDVKNGKLSFNTGKLVAGLAVLAAGATVGVFVGKPR